MRNFRTTHYKAILTGNILEFYTFQRAVYYGFQSRNYGPSVPKEKTEEEKMDIKKRSLQRTRGNLRRLINSNSRNWFDDINNPYGPKFITLTFKENLQDLKTANSVFTKFIKRLNYKILNSKKSGLKYSAIPEFQKRGAVHFHAVFYNLPYLDADLLADIWDQGFIRINAIDRIDNVGSYMTKYMSKDAMDERLAGRKRYFCSRNLKKPLNYMDHERMLGLVEIIRPHPVKYKTEFESEHLGLIKYKNFNLNDNLLLKENVLKYLNNPKPPCDI